MLVCLLQSSKKVSPLLIVSASKCFVSHLACWLSCLQQFFTMLSLAFSSSFHQVFILMAVLAIILGVFGKCDQFISIFLFLLKLCPYILTCFDEAVSITYMCPESMLLGLYKSRILTLSFSSFTSINIIFQ